jgi:hypothetical protein
MTPNVIFKWLNNDSTADLNQRFASVFVKGISEGGIIAPVSGELSVDITPYYAMTDAGLLVTDPTTYRFENLTLNQATVLTVYAKWLQADEPIIEYRAYEVSDYNNLLDKGDHVVFGLVTLSGIDTEVQSSNIAYSNRDVFDKLGRSPFRGFLASAVDLPANTNDNNLDGDFYIVGGSGGLVEIYAWNGIAWLNITNTLALQAELTNHRNNAYTNEKHLTDDEKDAVLGTVGIPNASNRFVTNQDTRIPTPSEKLAIGGSHGTPSATNKFVTEEFPLAEPSYLVFPLAPSTISFIGVGSVYVGKGAVGSANTYFSLMQIGLDRGYTSSTGIFPKITSIFKDNLLTQPLNPGVDADSDGFYAGNLYIIVNNPIDTGVRVAFGMKKTLKVISKGFDIIKGPASDFVPGEVVQHIQNIKGRPYDTLLPVDEGNKVLRTDIDNLISYLGSNQATTIVAANEDYKFFQDDTKLGPIFVRDIDVNPVYTFQNTGLNSFAYSPTTGLVTYTGSPNLASVLVGNLFRDGFGNFFKVVSVNNVSKQVGIVEIDTGLRPLSIISSNAVPADGSVRTNNNPRNLLLSELKGNAHEIIKINDLYRLHEFSKPEGRPAFGIIQSNKRLNPRVVLYGSFVKKADVDTGEIEVYNATAIGDIQITGFITHVYLWCKVTTAAPNLEISLNNEQVLTVVSVSQLGAASAVGYINGERFQRVKLIGGLNPDVCTTVNARIQGVTADPLVIAGLEVLTIPSASANKAIEVAIESGIGFENTRINAKNTRSITAVFPASNRTGSNYSTTLDRDINGNTVVNVIDTPMPELDFDPNYPVLVPGTSTQYSPQNAGEATKLALFKTGDVVELIGTTKNEKKRLLGTTPFVVLDSACTVTENKTMRLICSLGDNTPTDSAEEWANRYEIITNFVNYTSTDFSTKNAAVKAQRYAVHTDGSTILGAKNAQISIDRRSVIIPQTTGTLDIGVMGTRLDLEFDNPFPVTLRISVDGSAEYDVAIPAGVNRKTVFNRSRYTWHEVHIKSITSSFELTHMTIYSLERGNAKTKPLLTTQDNVSPFKQDYAKDEFPFRYSLGKVFQDAFKFAIPTKGAGVNPTWTYADTAHYLGRVLTSENDGDALKHTFIGEGVEIMFLARPDGGRAVVQVDGVNWNVVPGATLIVNGTVSQYLDTYSASATPKVAAITGLSYGEHVITVTQDNPRTKNVSSTGFNVGIFGFSTLSIGGKLRWTYDFISGHYSPLVDGREYASFYAAQIGETAFPIESVDEVKSAYAKLDGSGVPINCAISSVLNKTRITLSYTYVVNAFPGTVFGELLVIVDGKTLPRFVAGSTAQAYYKEINANVIELDGDYSTSPYDISVIKINGPTEVSIPLVNPIIDGGLGDFVYSPALSLAQFQAIRNTKWVAVNGASIAGSDLAAAGGFDTLPVMAGWYVKINN